MESIKRNEKKDETTNTEELAIKEIIEEPEVKVETKTIKKRKVKVKAVNTSKD